MLAGAYESKNVSELQDQNNVSEKWIKADIPLHLELHS